MQRQDTAGRDVRSLPMRPSGARLSVHLRRFVDGTNERGHLFHTGGKDIDVRDDRFGIDAQVHAQTAVAGQDHHGVDRRW